ncbi:SRPBCC family protein [Sabulilitoribacter multivorans]|uniref:SRPBCC family protein n=2 Tax=Flaviramulus multivorans TaxID=1304750 RepID=A0ABS9IKG9_9FLAO|nr:SRPBCC family protein [Flaviramulus multivorans]MCF7561093.1 SRPBCC family protein [Flaviramulus multivorans]
MITVETTIKAPIEKVWEFWTKPEHITNWNFASDDWCCPSATNDLRPDGKFVWRMEAKDGSMGFDFNGIYNQIEKHKFISYTMEDGRNVEIEFKAEGDNIKLTESFEPETTNPVEMQRAGWQAILENFKKLVESSK